MVRSVVEVAIRTRPTAKFAKELKLDTERGRIDVHKSADGHSGDAVNNCVTDWSFRFNNLLHNANQEEVYDAMVRPVVDSCIQGYNGTVMAYGQTGAGKTFTIFGGTQNYSKRGLAPRAINHVFNAIRSKPETAVVVRISYLEVYNERFYDLLSDVAPEERPDLAVMEDSRGDVQVKGLSKVVSTNEEDALNLLFTGDMNRAIGEHALNSQSSRSHAVFTIHLESRSRVEAAERVVTSKLHLVDLAGSERLKKTGTSGLALREAGYINKSLSFLEQVVIALSSRSRDHIPYRSSKLTNVLRDSLGGNCKTRLIANIWPESSHVEETISTMKFATRMMRISTDATINVQLDPMLLCKKYEREIRQLKQELAMHDTLANRSPQNYDDYTPEQQEEAMSVVKQYCGGEIGEIDISSLRQVHEYFKQFKILVRSLQHDLKTGAPAARAGDAEQAEEKAADAPKGDEDGEEYVGELDEAASGFHIGTAADDARPTGDVSLPSPHVKQPEAEPPRPAAQEWIDEDAAFDLYLEGEGRHLNEAYEENKRQHSAKKREFKELSSTVNACKRSIDELKAKVAQKREAHPARHDQAAEVIDEEEYAFIRELKTQKEMYVETYHKRTMVQSEISFLKGTMQQSKLKLCNEFLKWYQAKYGTVEHGANAGAEEVLDDAEQFAKLEMERVMQRDPDSVAYFGAQKNLKETLRKSKRRAVKPSGRTLSGAAAGW